ncbi:MAG: hypothetical protein ACI841_002557 [Planctomycetota bacterium]|jgi:hypothetical protein
MPTIWKDLRKVHRDASHAITAGTKGHLARNRGQSLCFEIDSTGFTVSPAAAKQYEATRTSKAKDGESAHTAMDHDATHQNRQQEWNLGSQLFCHGIDGALIELDAPMKVDSSSARLMRE